MREQTIVYGLLILGVLIIPAQMYLANRNFELLQQSGGYNFVSLLICMKNQTNAIIAQPANPSSCEEIIRRYRKLDANMCAVYEEGKSDTCKQIIRIADERKADCIQGLVTGNFKYKDGYPDANLLCEQLIRG